MFGRRESSVGSDDFSEAGGFASPVDSRSRKIFKGFQTFLLIPAVVVSAIITLVLGSNRVDSLSHMEEEKRCDDFVQENFFPQRSAANAFNHPGHAADAYSESDASFERRTGFNLKRIGLLGMLINSAEYIIGMLTFGVKNIDSDELNFHHGLLGLLFRIIKAFGRGFADIISDNKKTVALACWAAIAATILGFWAPAALTAIVTLSYMGFSLSSLFGTSVAGSVAAVACAVAMPVAACTFVRNVSLKICSAVQERLSRPSVENDQKQDDEGVEDRSMSLAMQRLGAGRRERSFSSEAPSNESKPVGLFANWRLRLGRANEPVAALQMEDIQSISNDAAI